MNNAKSSSAAARENKTPSPLNLRAVRTMQANRRRDTSPEIAVRSHLRTRGLTGYRLDVDVIGRPDIAFTRLKVAIFVHGCFWHDCTRCKPRIPKHNRKFWLNKRKMNRRRDARVARLLRKSGWSVFTVWECAVKSDVSKAAERAISAIMKRR